MDKKCKHCHKHIVLINGYAGPVWYHQPEGASFNDGMHLYCETQAAEPEEIDATS